MANDASVTVTATLLPDEIAKTFTGSTTLSPDDANDKWYYKKTNVATNSGALMSGYFTDYTAVDGDTAPTAIADGDKVKFLFVKNTDAAESVYIIPPATPVTAGSFVIGSTYVILSAGTTDFTTIGAADSNVGTVFTAAGATVTAGDFIIGRTYEIVTAGTTDFTTIGSADSNVGTVFTAAGATVTAGSFIVGREYEINTPGTTDFTLIGAADSNAGTVFTATGVGAGDGTADEQTVAGSGDGTADETTNAGSGTGTAELTASVETTGFHIGPSEALTIRLPNRTVDNIHAASSTGTVECLVAALLDDV